MPWTVNDPGRMAELIAMGVDGIISDRPDLLRAVAGSGIDVQGHRGARGLRPENTLPAMEAALDCGVTTLETDCGVSADGVAVLCHDPYLEPRTCRRAGDRAHGEGDAILVSALTVAEIQSGFIADRLPFGGDQRAAADLSPASVSFTLTAGLLDIYVVPTLEQLFAFVDFYADFHRSDPTRSAVADRVRFNIETKIDPPTNGDRGGNVIARRTADPEAFVEAVTATVGAHGYHDRADIQSFDRRTLRLIHERHPEIRTVCLFGGPAPISRGGRARR